MTDVTSDNAFREAHFDKCARIQEELFYFVVGPDGLGGRRPGEGPRPRPPDADEKEAEWNECAGELRDVWPLFDQFRDASTDAAADALAVMARVRDRLREQDSNDQDSEIALIRRHDIVGWEGEAAKEFDRYLGDLGNAFGYQWQFAASLHGVMELHQKSLYAAREGILDICDTTLQKLDAAHEARARKQREELAGALGRAFEFVADLATEGPGAAVKKAVVDLGGSLIRQIGEPEETEEWRVIVDWMRSTAKQLRYDVRDEQAKLRTGLDALQPFVDGDRRRDVLAPLIPGQDRSPH